MALLALAQATLGEAAIEVATIDHGLRPEATAECSLVMRECGLRGIPCRTLEVSVAQGNLQEQARLARYHALGAWARERGLPAIATAHHADDQAETLVMRLNRGSGLSGLAGIRQTSRIAGSEVVIIRPLLGFRRSELRGILAALDMPFVEDPSNRDERFERVRMRKALAGSDWIDPAALARSAAYLAEAEAALDAIVDDLWAREAAVKTGEIGVPHGGPADIAARLLLRAIGELGGDASYGQAVGFLQSPDQRANFAGVLVEKREGRLVCRPEPPRRTG